MRATLSLLGLYNWDNSILDGLTLPSNFAAEDRDILINNLLIETAEFEILYTDPSFLKLAITQWCNKRKSTWEWMRETQLFEYNPLWNENYNDDITRDLHGTLDATDLRTDNLQRAKSGSDTLTKTGDDTLKNTGDDTVKKTGYDTAVNSVYGFNQQGFAAPKDTTQTTYNNQSKTDYDSQSKTTYDTEDKTVYNNTVNDTGTQQQKLDHDTSDTGTIKRQVQGLHGAFPQEAIEKEQNLAMLNLLDFIINDFKKRFCLLVY